MGMLAAVNWVVSQYEANFDTDTEVRTIVGHPLEGKHPLPSLITFPRSGNIHKPYPGKLHDTAAIITEFHYARAMAAKVATSKVDAITEKVAQILQSDHTLGGNVLLTYDVEWELVRFQLADGNTNQGILFTLPLLHEFSSSIS